jgi:hypothetical protein
MESPSYPRPPSWIKVTFHVGSSCSDERRLCRHDDILYFQYQDGLHEANNQVSFCFALLTQECMRRGIMRLETESALCALVCLFRETILLVREAHSSISHQPSAISVWSAVWQTANDDDSIHSFYFSLGEGEKKRYRSVYSRPPPQASDSNSPCQGIPRQIFHWDLNQITQSVQVPKYNNELIVKCASTPSLPSISSLELSPVTGQQLVRLTL